MRPPGGEIPGTPSPAPISTRRRRIALQGRGREVTGEFMTRRAGCLSRARPAPWGPGVGNHPGLPDLTHLAVHGRVAASTQNQALAALLFLYQKVLETELPTLDAVRAKRPKRLPVVLSTEEVRAVLDRMAG